MLRCGSKATSRRRSLLRDESQCPRRVVLRERGRISRHPMPRMKKIQPIAAFTDASDTELVRRVAGGETAAFETLMRRHNRTLFRTARAILRDDAEAEDTLQEAYLQAYQAIGTFRGEAKLTTWFARIVANESLMRLRKHARRADIVPLQPAAVLDGIDQIA